jgi:hypothetical protein
VVQLLGIELEVGRGADKDTVGAADVVLASTLAGLAAWGVHAVMARKPRSLQWWPLVGTTALSASMAGPAWFADGSTAIALMGMHFAVGIVLIVGLSMTRRGDVCQEDAVSRKREPQAARQARRGTQGR